MTSLDSLTRTCLARGISASRWTLLARETAAGAGQTAQDVESELSRSLLDLIAADLAGTTRALEYLESASSRDVRLLRPIGVARALLDRPATSTLTTETVFARILASQAQSAASLLFAEASESELAEAVEAFRRRLLPIVRANPNATLSCQQWLVSLVQHTTRVVMQTSSSSTARTRCLSELRSLREELAGVNTERVAALERDLAGLMNRSSKRRRRRRQPAPSNLQNANRVDRSMSPDSALLAASLLLDPYIPPTLLAERLQGLLRYRCDQAIFRGSTPPEGAALLLEEILGSLIWALHSATTHAFVLESLVYAKVPESIESCLGHGDSAVTYEVLRDALRRLRGTVAEGSDAPDAQSGLSLQDAYNQLVTSLCQQGTLSPSEGGDLAFDADATDLQPLTAVDLEQKLASADLATFSAFLQEHVHNFGSQARSARSIAQDFKRRADALDLGTFADFCEVLVAHTDELAAVLLHVAPQELLGPIRHVLDVVAASPDDSSDSIAIERCGTLVNFLQIGIHRFKLQDDLDRHLGSSSSPLSTWLRDSSATFTLSHLAENERNVVNGWISALFGEGISDDLVHSTNPMTLFKVAPTILKQSVMACRVGVIDIESLRDAMSYYLQELLRYSLPGAIEWLINEVARTPDAKAQQPLLEVLRIFCQSDALPPSVLELVSSEVIKTVVSGHTFTTPERLRVLKAMVPFTPTRSPVAWAANPQQPTETTTTTDNAQQAGGARFPFILTERDRLASLASSGNSPSVNKLEAYLGTHHTHGSGTAALPSEVTSEYGRLERSAAAMLAANEVALSHIVLEASRMVLGRDAAIAADRAAFVGDALGGALTITESPKRARHLRVLARACEATTVGTSASGDASASAAVIDRLLSWPTVAAYPAFSRATGNLENMR